MPEILYAVLALAIFTTLAVMIAWLIAQSKKLKDLSSALGDALEQKHRAMLSDLHDGLTRQGDRLGGHLTESSERLRGAVTEELKQTRDTLQDRKSVV